MGHDFITGHSNFLDFVMSDEALNLDAWFIAFQQKLPNLLESDFKKCMEEAKVRAFLCLTGTSLSKKLHDAIAEHDPAFVMVTLATSEDPSKSLTDFIYLLKTIFFVSIASRSSWSNMV